MPHITTTSWRFGRGRSRSAVLLGLLGVLLGPPAPGQTPQAGLDMGAVDTCVVVAAENLVQGGGNWYLYLAIGHHQHVIQAGDHLEYDIYLPATNPLPRGGIDGLLIRETLPAEKRGHPWLRDMGLRDHQGLTLHADAALEPAVEQWYSRRFDLSPLTGVTLEGWTVAFEGDSQGRYVQFLDNIRVTRAGAVVARIYTDGPAPGGKLHVVEGYSRTVLLSSVPRLQRFSAPAVTEIMRAAHQAHLAEAARLRYRSESALAEILAERLHDPAMADTVRTAKPLAPAADPPWDGPCTDIGSTHRARHPLAHLQPRFADFTGHVVGHGHIDLQWLWTWDETTDRIIPDTFGQAVKFMGEFPEFTFTQSSPALYLATEQHHPELFKRIQELERAGRWEIVGGRWCEGDLNMISPESHARHLLYGQRYFASRFGHICDVAWEPDTFGHPWTMPQILKKGGIDYYYFCRAGRNEPLFWWEGPDGSRLLAFEEPATGGWYNDTINDESVLELGRFVRRTGTHDHLMVYGVGNHGGGPTREHIESAQAMRDRVPWPQVKFSTCAEFFRRIGAEAGQLQLPTIRGELNSVFEGCYTSHARIKKFNRDSETLLESTEVFATLYALNGGAYPRAALESMWQDVLWSHHHDTICGSFIHPAYLYSEKLYGRLLDDGRQLLTRTQRGLARRIAFFGTGPHVVVFNPLAWPRTAVVEVELVLPSETISAVLTDGYRDLPTQLLERRDEGDAAVLRVCFAAGDVPGCGFKTFAVRAVTTPTDIVAADAPPAAAAAKGPILQILHEVAHAASAWEVGAFDQTTNLQPIGPAQILESGPVRWRERETFRYDKSTIVQDRVTYAGHDRVDFETEVEWLQIGNPREGSPMLKAAFSTGIASATVVYDVPFGDVTRPQNGRESVALKWCAVADANRFAAVFNDCKHGYDVKDGVIRLSLLRASYEPDPTPDVGVHRMRYAFLLEAGPLDRAAVVRTAWEFNKPLQPLVVDSPSGDGNLSLTWSGCKAEPANIVLTALKMAEDSNDIILRAYECAGQTATATLTLGWNIEEAAETDLLEREIGRERITADGTNRVQAEFTPYEIRTFRLRTAIPGQPADQP